MNYEQNIWTNGGIEKLKTLVTELLCKEDVTRKRGNPLCDTFSSVGYLRITCINILNRPLFLNFLNIIFPETLSVEP